MKRFVKSGFAVVLALVMLLGAAPLSGFMGLSLPEWMTRSGLAVQAHAETQVPEATQLPENKQVQGPEPVQEPTKPVQTQSKVKTQALPPETAGETDAITRSAWIHALVSVFQMTVEQDNVPENYYTDIDSEHPHYRDIMVAVEFGVIDLEPGYPFYPDAPADRDFAAHTLNFCLGFQIEDENPAYPFLDSAVISYPNDALIAVNRNWFSLVAGNFMPERTVTSAEKDFMLEDANTVWKSTEIEEGYENTYEFDSDVIEIPEGTDVTADANEGITIIDCPQAISAGQVFVVWFHGIPKAYKAQSVSVSGAETKIVTAAGENVDVDNAIVAADAQGAVPVDWSSFEPAEGVTIKDAPKPLMRMIVDAERGESRRISLTIGAVSVELDVSISAIFKLDTAKRYCYLGIKGSEATETSIGAEFEDSVKLGRIPVYGFGFVDLSLYITVDGKISLTFSNEFNAGVEYSDGDFRLVHNFVKDKFTLSVEASLSIGLKLSAGIDLFLAKGELYVKAGPTLKMVSELYPNKPFACTHCAGKMSVAIGASLEFGSDKFSKEHSSFVGETFVMHWEDGIPVNPCTRNPSDHYGNGYQSDPYSHLDHSSNQSDYKYSVSNGKATITKYIGTAKNVVIPATLGGYPVESIGYSAFAYRTSITSVIIPDCITSIGGYAFQECTGLVSIKIGTSVTSIGSSAFYGCTSLLAVTIPNSVTSIGVYAFYGCTSLPAVTIPNSVNSIGSCAFYGCTSLPAVVIPNGVTSIDNHAFYGCTSLSAVTIPNSVNSIGNSAFGDCPIEILDINMATIPTLYSQKAALKKVIIGSNVTSIGYYAFNGCTSLPTVTIPNSVTSIGSSAFRDCTSLKRVHIPTSIETISIYAAFYGCPSIMICSPSTTGLAKSYADSHSIPFELCTGHDSTPHTTHSYGAWKTTKAATCTEAGTKTRSCTVCNQTETQPITKLGHDSGKWFTVTQATTTKDGKRELRCTRCQAVIKSEVLPKNPNIKLSKTAVTLGVKESFAPVVTLDAPITVTWSSADKTIATVDAAGKITTAKAGTVVITAKTAMGKTATCTVTVKPAPTSITLNKSAITLGVKETFTATATLAPSGAASYKRTWSSSNKAVAIVDTNGKITALKAGTATITLTLYNGVKKSMTVTVKAAPTSITLNKTAVTLGVKETFTTTATLAPSGAASYKRVWSSSNKAVAIVDTNGKSTALKAGTATITLTLYNGVKKSMTVTVKAAPTGIALNKTAVTLGVKETFTAAATLAPSGAASYKRVWSSSNKAVAIVDTNGKITALKAGTATITLTLYNGVKKSMTVTVKAAPTSITLNKTAVTLGVKETFAATATLAPSGAASYKRTWSSSNKAVAIVDTNGKITALKAGTATITLTLYNGVKKSITVTVKPAPTSVKLTPNPLTMTKGTTKTLAVTLNSGAASYARKFSSSNTAVVKVDAKTGKLTAVKAGTAIITVKVCSGKTASCKVTVK